MESYQFESKKDEKGKFIGMSDSDRPERVRRKRASKTVGMGHDKLSKAKQVVEAAKENPEKYQQLVDGMAKTVEETDSYKLLSEGVVNLLTVFRG